MGLALLQQPAAVGTRLPYVRRWDFDAPLPVRVLRPGPAMQQLPLGAEPPPWVETGPAGRPFDFCAGMSALCADICRHCPELCHVRVEQILFGITRARNGRRHGLQARVTPLRLRGGHLIRRSRGTFFQVQRYVADSREILYLMTFCLPRFLDQGFDDKFVTVFHELYHISPAFDGDLRRHRGRYCVHTASKRAYDAHMADLARAYLCGGANTKLHGFLRLNFDQLCHRHGTVAGTVIPWPKLVPFPTD